MKKSVLVLSALILVSAQCLLAEGTRLWKQSSFDDFEKGTAKGVASPPMARATCLPRRVRRRGCTA